ncbi:Probable enoyl-CoA hydratase 2, mitochondrial [Linum perenne]
MVLCLVVIMEVNLYRPKARNTTGSAMLRGLRNTFETLETDDESNVVKISISIPKVFCTGSYMKDFMEDNSTINKENVDPTLRGVDSKGFSAQIPTPSVKVGLDSAHCPSCVDGIPVTNGTSVKPKASVGSSPEPTSEGMIATEFKAQLGPVSGSSFTPVDPSEGISTDKLLSEPSLINSRSSSGVSKEEAQKASVSNRG